MKAARLPPLTCEGCHAEGNAMGAPHPDHEGIPPVHFAKMTCTACHSGPLPETEHAAVQERHDARAGRIQRQ